jgi:DNA-binding response OmpR family regulator
MKRILSISYNEALLQTREMLLRFKGYEVESAFGYAAAIRACKNGNFDLAVIGHSIPREGQEAMIEQLKAICPTPVLALRRVDENPVASADYTMDLADPAEFINYIDGILSGKK